MVTVGDKLIDFTLAGYLHNDLRSVKSKNYSGRWQVLIFYQLDFTPICQSEIAQLSELYEEFRKSGAELFAISTDSVYAHQAWARELGELNFPLLSDFTKRISHQLGVLDDESGIAKRATLIVDGTGTIRWVEVASDLVGRNFQETLRVLHALQTGQACAANWQPGDKFEN